MEIHEHGAGRAVAAWQPAAKSSPELTAKDIARFDLRLGLPSVGLCGWSLLRRTLRAAEGKQRVVRGQPGRTNQGQCARGGRTLDRARPLGREFFHGAEHGFFPGRRLRLCRRGQTWTSPIHLLFIGASEQSGATSFPRSLIAGRGQRRGENHRIARQPGRRAARHLRRHRIGAGRRMPRSSIARCSRKANAPFTSPPCRRCRLEDSRWTSHSIALGGAHGPQPGAGAL